MGQSVVYPSVPRSGPSSARKRSASRALESWESQDDYMKQEVEELGEELGEEVVQAIGEQWQYGGDDEPTGDVSAAAPTREFKPPPARPPAEPTPGASSGSWSTVEDPDPSEPVDIEDLARNKNRHAAPIDWEADVEQGR